MNNIGITQIKASAGSGKTFTLTRLFLELLSHSSYPNTTNTCTSSYHWNDILAMTFTNKAVAEMKMSVLSLLKNIALGLAEEQKILPQKEASFWVDTILNQYDALRIQSIDSLLLKIIKLSSLSLELPANCKPLLEEEATYVIETMYTSFLLESKYNKEYQELLEKSWKTLVAEEPKGLFMKRTFKETIKNLVSLMLTEGYFIPIDNTTDMYSAYTYYIDILQEKYGKRKLENNIYTPLEEIKKIIAKHSIEGIHANFIKALDKPLIASGVSKLLSKNTFLDVTTKKYSSPSSAIEHELEILYASVRNAVILYEYSMYSISKAIQYAPLVGIAQQILLRINEYQKQHEVFLFSSAPRLVEKIFTNEENISEALFHMGTHLQHILIDEFQDTSTAQWRALYSLIDIALSSGGSFTYVGDVKQAIYSWRGGDSSLFESILNDFPINNEKNVLPDNWRSAEPIVSLTNIFSEMEHKEYAVQFLKAFFPKATLEEIETNYPELLDSAITKLQTAYTDGKQNISTKTQHLTGKVQIVELLEAQEEDANNDDTNETDIVKKEVYEILQKCMQKYPLHDITFLTRANAESKIISEWLLHWKIPYSIEGGIFLQDSPLIQHIIAFLSFIHTEDSNTFWTILTSSICKAYIPQEQLIEWRIQHKKSNLVHQFKIDFPELWEQCFAVFCNIPSLYIAYHYAQEIVQYFSLYERFPEQKIYIQALLENMYSCKEDTVSIPTFLEYWEKNKEQFTVPSGSGSNLVQILTIHKSKGLEFPVVIIPFSSGTKKGHPPLEKLYVQDILPEAEYKNAEELLDIPVITKVKKPHPLSYKKDLEGATEALNIMYVAYTRAKYELYIIIDSTKKQKSYAPAEILKYILNEITLSKKHKVIQTTELPHKKIYEYSTMEENKIHTVEPIQNTHNTTTETTSTFALPTQYTLMKCLPNIKIQHTKPETSMLKISATERGILLHKAMELLRRAEDIPHILGYVLATIATEYYTECYTYLDSRLNWFVHNNNTQYLLQEGLYEQAILIREPEGIVRPDKILQNNDVWTVVEYKTGAQYKEHHIQILQYMDIITQITPLSVEGKLIYFDEEKIITL